MHFAFLQLLREVVGQLWLGAILRHSSFFQSILSKSRIIQATNISFVGDYDDLFLENISEYGGSFYLLVYYVGDIFRSCPSCH